MSTRTLISSILRIKDSLPEAFPISSSRMNTPLKLFIFNLLHISIMSKLLKGLTSLKKALEKDLYHIEALSRDLHLSFSLESQNNQYIYL